MNPRLLPLLGCLAALAVTVSAQNTPLRIEQTVEARFPFSLALTPLTHGRANVLVSINDRGILEDLLVTGYTHPEFALEAVTVLKQWRFTPPTENGRPLGVRKELRFMFTAEGKVISLLAIETPEVLLAQAFGTTRLIGRVCPPHELDRPIAPVAPVSPVYPGQIAGRHPKDRTVVIDFYVDEKGVPRMPVVVSSPHDALAEAAVGALTQWRFTNPTRAGKPVNVRVQQEFVFPAAS